jgi:pyruvate/2-oxoglutarate dehydrogenase complex dihydrolipoamide acyltransferase (E2) component
MPDKYMTLTRPYPRGGVIHPVGRVLRVSEAIAGSIEDGQWGREATADEVEQAFPSAPKASEEAAVVASPAQVDAATVIDATDAARALADASSLDLLPYAGKGTGTGGRITKGDVEGWLEPPQTEPQA